jgi:hypothetical protein
MATAAAPPGTPGRVSVITRADGSRQLSYDGHPLRGGLQLTGPAGWLAWLCVHLWYLVGFRNRLIALGSWANYYRGRRPLCRGD